MSNFNELDHETLSKVCGGKKKRGNRWNDMVQYMKGYFKGVWDGM